MDRNIYKLIACALIVLACAFVVYYGAITDNNGWAFFIVLALALTMTWIATKINRE